MTIEPRTKHHAPVTARLSNGDWIRIAVAVVGIVGSTFLAWAKLTADIRALQVETATNNAQVERRLDRIENFIDRGRP